MREWCQKGWEIKYKYDAKQHYLIYQLVNKLQIINEFFIVRILIELMRELSGA